MLRHHDRNLASLSQNIPNNLGNPGFFTKYPTAAESPLCLSGYPRLPLREAVSPSNRHCQEPAVVGRHAPINSVISIIYLHRINICTLVAAPHTVSVESEGLQGFATKHVIILVVTVTRRWPHRQYPPTFVYGYLFSYAQYLKMHLTLFFRIDRYEEHEHSLQSDKTTWTRQNCAHPGIIGKKWQYSTILKTIKRKKIYIRTYIHTYIHTYVRTYIHTYIHTDRHAYKHTYIHIYM